MVHRVLGVRFDEHGWQEDLEHASSAAADVARRARERLEAQGVTLTELHPCEPEARDGTRLVRCAKIYLPPPDGQWGMVFRVVRVESELALSTLAFGERHPRRPWRPSVYEVAHYRLHGSRPPAT